jgi:hypothetical protein
MDARAYQVTRNVDTLVKNALIEPASGCDGHDAMCILVGAQHGRGFSFFNTYGPLYTSTLDQRVKELDYVLNCLASLGNPPSA